MQPHPSVQSLASLPEPEIAVASMHLYNCSKELQLVQRCCQMHRKLPALTGKSGTELNWISARCKNPQSLTCTTIHINVAYKSFEMHENKDFRKFPTKDNLRIKDKELAPKMSFIRRFHCMPSVRENYQDLSAHISLIR